MILELMYVSLFIFIGFIVLACSQVDSELENFTTFSVIFVLVASALSRFVEPLNANLIQFASLKNILYYFGIGIIYAFLNLNYTIFYKCKNRINEIKDELFGLSDKTNIKRNFEHRLSCDKLINFFFNFNSYNENGELQFNLSRYNIVKSIASKILWWPIHIIGNILVDVIREISSAIFNWINAQAKAYFANIFKLS